MKSLVWIVFAACLSQGFVAGAGLMGAMPAVAAQLVGPGAVWQPGPRFINTVREECKSLDGSRLNDCFASVMRKGGPSPEAMAFTKMVDNEGYLSAFSQAGPVGIAHVVYPVKANEKEGILLVNGSPPVIDVDDFGSLPEKDMKQDPLYQDLLKEYPSISLWPGDRSPGASPEVRTLNDEGTALDFRYRLLDGCRACKVLGYAYFAFDFDSTGKFLGMRFSKVEKVAGSTPGTGGSMKTGKRGSGSEGAFHLTVGEEFKITLDSNATTGFQWSLAAPVNESVVKLVSNAYEAPQTRLAGAGGKEVWTFRAVGRGQTEIRMKYSRSWEKGTPPARGAVFSVTVE